MIISMMRMWQHTFMRHIKVNRKRQIIGVYKRSAACDIVQLEHLDNQIDAKVPSYLRF